MRSGDEASVSPFGGFTRLLSSEGRVGLGRCSERIDACPPRVGSVRPARDHVVCGLLPGSGAEGVGGAESGGRRAPGGALGRLRLRTESGLDTTGGHHDTGRVIIEGLVGRGGVGAEKRRWRRAGGQVVDAR